MSRLKSIANGKCPQCRSGGMFKYPLSNLPRFYVMNNKCPCCNLAFSVEPGFFIGAMYISYIAVVGLVILMGMVLFTIFNDPPIWVYSTVVTSGIILLIPLLFRFSRILFLHMFGGIVYNPIFKSKNC